MDTHHSTNWARRRVTLLIYISALALSQASIFVSICPVCALTFESLDLETWFFDVHTLLENV